MSDRKAVVRKLSAVEALGSVTVIATDKTGTLTENTMTVARPRLPRPPSGRCKAMVLAADAEPDGGIGDPLEIGLYTYAAAQGVDPVTLRMEHPRQSVRPFDSAWRFMRVSVTEDGQTVAYLKGAAEVLLERSTLDAAERSDGTNGSRAQPLTATACWASPGHPTTPKTQLTWLGVGLAVGSAPPRGPRRDRRRAGGRHQSADDHR